MELWITLLSLRIESMVVSDGRMMNVISSSKAGGKSENGLPQHIVVVI